MFDNQHAHRSPTRMASVAFRGSKRNEPDHPRVGVVGILTQGFDDLRRELFAVLAVVPHGFAAAHDSGRKSFNATNDIRPPVDGIQSANGGKNETAAFANRDAEAIAIDIPAAAVCYFEGNRFEIECCVNSLPNLFELPLPSLLIAKLAEFAASKVVGG